MKLFESPTSKRLWLSLVLTLSVVLFTAPLAAHEILILPSDSDDLLVAIAAKDHLDSAAVDFGEVLSGNTAEVNVTVTNLDSRRDVTVSIEALPAGVTVVPSQLSLTTAGTGGSTGSLQVTYDAESLGPFSGIVPLSVQHDGVAKPQAEEIAYQGSVIDIADIVPESVDFGQILVDNEAVESLTVTNTSEWTVTVTPQTPLPGDLAIFPAQVTLAPAGSPGSASSFDLTYLGSQTADLFSGTVDFGLSFSGVTGTRSESLTYTGEVVDPVPVHFTPQSLDFGTVPIYTTVTKYLSVTNPAPVAATLALSSVTESVIISSTSPVPLPESGGNAQLEVMFDAGPVPGTLSGTLIYSITYAGITGSATQEVPYVGKSFQEIYTPIASPRGFRPNQPYQFGEIDAVDTASGNVTIRIPLGQVYEVGPMIRYQFTAVNNSNAWDYVEIPCPQNNPGCNPAGAQTFAVPNAGSNAGLGWELHFGKLFGPTPPAQLDQYNKNRWPTASADISDNEGQWLYVAPDGARHTLHPLPGRTGTHSKDGSFLRLRDTGTNEPKLDFPDGRYVVFEKTDSHLGTDFCGNGIGGCWRFKEMKDPFFNKMSVAYSEDSTNELEIWTITDSTGRSHSIRFDISDAGTAGGDGPATYSTQFDHDEWGDLRRVVKDVNLDAFSGTAKYEFVYDTPEIGRSCPQINSALHLAADPTIVTRVLTEIAMPKANNVALAPSWKFDTDTSIQTTCGGDKRGKITEVTMPTRGRIQYTYGDSWRTPTRCDYRAGGDESALPDYNGNGVTQRKRLKPDGTEDGTWKYTSDIHPATGLGGSGSDCTRAKYRVTTVDGPQNTDGKHTRTVTYHSIWEGPRDPRGDESGTGWQVTDRGLPYTKDEPYLNLDNLNELFLSSKIYQCNGAACGSPVRSTYRRYVSEFRNICNKANGVGDSPECYQINPIQLAERTIYHDDGGNYIETRNSDYDGAGHFRVQTTEDNLQDNNGVTRSVTTEYSATGGQSVDIDSLTGYFSPGTPSSYLPGTWILTPYSRVTKDADGRTYVTETQFSSGVLSCSRAWRDENNRSKKDVVVELTLGSSAGVNAGLPTTETVSGGEYADLSTASLCEVDSTTTDGRKYTFDHTYADLQLKSTRIDKFPYRYSANINQATGLPSKVFNGADEAETLAFDLLGRLTKITPDATRNEAVTEFTYSNPAGSNPSLTVERKDGTTLLSRETTTYDHFGRMITQGVLHPDGTTVNRNTVYDKAGNMTEETTLGGTPGGPGPQSWRHSLFDAFGRLGKTFAPDGGVTKYFYKGVRERVVEIQVAIPGQAQDKDTTTIQDAWGRIVRVGVEGVSETDYVFDPNGNVTKAIRKMASGISSQVREYGYDARGYLLSENLPEIAGTTSYKVDALGLPRQVTGGGNDLKYSYDLNGRLVEIREAEVNGKLWKTWAYGTQNVPGDQNVPGNQALGRLVNAARYNYPPGQEAVVILENYEYQRGTAGPSQTQRQIYWADRSGNDRWGATFKTTFDYDKLGNLSSLTYPLCIQNSPSQGEATPCADGDDLLPPGGVETWTYTNGLMTKVETNAAVIGAEYTYHPNLQLATAGFNNGISGIYDEGVAHMARPTRRQFKKDETTLFDTGTYSYDWAGNIKSIGSDIYKYDAGHRLVKATVKAAGPSREENYTYDTADNMTTVNSDLFGTRTFDMDPATNRLLEVTTTGDAPIIDFTYDNAGNVTSVAGGAFQFDWDALNMQTRFTKGGVEYISVYGPGDYRVWLEEPASEVKHWTSRGPGGKILREFKVTGDGEIWTHEKDFVYGAEGILASRRNDGTIQFYHTDHLGTTRLFTSVTGTELSQHHYYPFGREVPPAGVDPCTVDNEDLSVKYTGHQRELHCESDYMLGRHYLIYPYRFASVDPARAGWNLYTYAGNNPLMFIDPDGRDLRLSFDFSNSSLSTAQQNAIASGIRTRFRNAGVRNVQIFFPQKTLFGEVGGPPSPTRPSERNVSLIFQDEVITSGSGKQTALGINDPPSTEAVLTTAHGGVTQMINTGAHEAGHASRALPIYDVDSAEPGTLLHAKPGKSGTIMEQGPLASVLDSALREFSEEDAANLRLHLNGD